MAEQGSSDAAPARWAIVELMGHRRTAGRISEVQVAGVPLLRIEVPAKRTINKLVEPVEVIDHGWAGEQQYGGASIYCLTPCTEEQARQFVECSYIAPLPMLTAGTTTISDERRTPTDPPRRGEPAQYDFGDDDLEEDEDVLGFDEADDDDDIRP